MHIISVSSRDLSKPFQGGTRLILSSLSALALAGCKVTHLYLTEKASKKTYSINVTDGKINASINVVEAFGGEDPRIEWFDRYDRYHLLPFYNRQAERAKKENELITVIDRLYDKSSVIICERRPVFLTCAKISKYLKVPLVLRIDVLTAFWALKRAQYTKSIVPMLKAPFAVLSYFLMTRYADYEICVAKELEEKLRRLGIKNIATVEPTHLMLSETDANTNYFKFKDKLIEDEDLVIISSRALEVIKFLASKTPYLKYIVIGKRPPLSVIKEMPKNVEWTGIIPDKILGHLYKRAICTAIYRPWMSGISMTLLETLHYGRPAIVNSACINNFKFSRFEGVLIANDICNWPVLIRKLQNDYVFKSDLETKAQNFFLKKFSWKKHASQMLKILKLLKSHQEELK